MPSLPTAGPPAPQTLVLLRTQVRAGLNEVTTLFWGNSEINFALNLCKDELWKIIRDAREDFFLYKTGVTPYFSLSIVSGTPTYALPTDCVDIRELISDPTATDGTQDYTFTFRDVSSPEFVSARHSSTSTSTVGIPGDFYCDIVTSQYDGTSLLYLAPTPQASFTALLTYIRSLPDMTDDDHTCDIPPEHHKIMVPMAIDYLMKKDRDQGYAIWKEHWKEMLAQVKSSIAKRQTADTEYVTTFDPGA